MLKVAISGFYDEVSSDFITQLKLVKELGESYMCPRKVGEKNIADYTAEEFAASVKPLMDEYGVKFSSIGSPIGKVDLDDEEGYKSQCEKLKELVKICGLVGCKYIRIFSFFVDAKGDYDAYLPKVVAKLKGFLEIVKGSDVILLHENEKKIFGDTPERCLALYDAIADEQFKLIYDASNYIQCSVDPKAAYDMVKDYVVYYHIKDCSPEKVEVPIGHGAGRYEELIADLSARNYEGFMTLEPHTAKYALLKNTINVLAPIAALIPPTKYFHRVFRRIDREFGKKTFEKVSTREVFLWQYNGLKKLISEVEGN